MLNWPSVPVFVVAVNNSTVAVDNVYSCYTMLDVERRMGGVKMNERSSAPFNQYFAEI